MILQTELFDSEIPFQKNDSVYFFTDLSKENLTFDSSPESKQLTTTFRGLYAHKWHDFFFGDTELSAEHIKNMKQNFSDNILGTELAIDYGHNAFDKAAGWVKSVDTSKDGKDLFLTVEWTPEATKAIKEKEWRYFSAEFAFNYIDQKSGEKGATLLGGGLTNRPFLKNLKPVLHSQKEKTKMEMISIETHKNEVKLLNDKIQSLEENVKKFSDNFLAKEEENKSLVSKVEKLEIELTAEKAEKIKTQKEMQFNDLLHEGKLNIAQKEAFLKGDVLALAQSMEKPNFSGPSSQRTSDKGEVSLSTEEKAMATSRGFTEEEWLEAKKQQSGNIPSFSLRN